MKKNEEKKNMRVAAADLRRSPRFSCATPRRSTRLSCARGETPAPNTALELPRRKRRNNNKTNRTKPISKRISKAKRFRYYLKRRLRRYLTYFIYGAGKGYPIYFLLHTQTNSLCLFIFLVIFFFGTEERTCILSSGQTFDWKENSSGTTWVAIHGTTPLCVVAMNTLPERDVPSHSTECHPPVHVVLRTALDQISDTSSALYERVAKYSQTGPFAVVSVAPGTIEDHQETSRKAYSRAISYLMSELKDRADFTCGEIVKIGLWALKYLFGSKFQSNKIQTFYYDGVGWTWCIGKLDTHLVDKYLNGFNETAAGDPHVAAAAINETTNSYHLAATINETSTSDCLAVNVINHH